MYASYKINSRLLNGATATTINIPINLEFQIVDNSELVENKFVKLEKEKAINPILDYDKAKFIPLDNNTNKLIQNITYNINFLDINNTMLVPTYYSDITISTSDILQQKNFFTESYTYLGFYDTNNAMTQNLVSEIEIYSHLIPQDYEPVGVKSPKIAGQPKQANQIPVRYTLSNRSLVPKGFYEGFNLYSYKDEYVVGALPNELFMKASYINAKTGRVINLMTEPIPSKIDTFINKLYTKYKLYRDTTGYYYKIDDTYSTNVKYSSGLNNSNISNVSVNLYQVQAL